MEGVVPDCFPLRREACKDVTDAAFSCMDSLSKFPQAKPPTTQELKEKCGALLSAYGDCMATALTAEKEAQKQRDLIRAKEFEQKRLEKEKKAESIKS